MMEINRQQIRGDIARRRAMPEFGVNADASLERIRTVTETQRSFGLEIVEALLDELEKAERSAQKIKVEMPESFYPDGDIDAPRVVDELEVVAAIVEAGGKPVAFCKRCNCELDLTHRPDGAHYCHPNG